MTGRPAVGEFVDLYVGLKGPDDKQYKPLAFKDKSGQVVLWFDTEQQASAKIDEVRDAIQDHYARPPNPTPSAAP